MASTFTHAFAAIVLGRIASSDQPRGWRFWVLAAGSAILPDADVIRFAFGVPYGDPLGHRGFFHSLFFALVWALFVAWCEFRQGNQVWRMTMLFFLFTASHALLDAMTNGGLGVAFFAPFLNTRYFLPWRPLEVSPISVTRFFQEAGGPVIRSELIYVWLPLVALWICIWTGRRAIRATMTASPGKAEDPE